MKRLGSCQKNRPYDTEYKNWLAHEKKAIKYAKGKILDIGCGAGKYALYLQNKGFDVIGIDVSPLAIKVCKKRGLKKAKVLSINKVDSLKSKFDTVLILGNNFGLLQNYMNARPKKISSLRLVAHIQ